MDLTEQNTFVEELNNFLARKLKGKSYHIIACVEDQGTGFSTAISTLTSESTYESLKVIMSGISEENELLMEKFKLPPDEKLNKPVEPKW